ncbi:hypothetical protein HMPREF3291_05295 [Bacillus sp. HMSC76G11]|nr:hypothetical protein HMPREF3291_05295 [Bacillus sp. HMSC76G11]
MDLRELTLEVLKDIDDSLTDSDIKGWLNRCLDDLTPVAKYQKMISIPLLAGEKTITLPDDLHEIVLLTDGECDYKGISLMDKTSIGYKRWENTLTLQPEVEEDSTFTLYYYARLPHLVEVTDVPVIRPDFHDLLVLYGVAKAKYKDELVDMQQTTMQEYFDRKNQFANEIIQGDFEVYQVRLME